MSGRGIAKGIMDGLNQIATMKYNSMMQIAEISRLKEQDKIDSAYKKALINKAEADTLEQQRATKQAEEEYTSFIKQRKAYQEGSASTLNSIMQNNLNKEGKFTLGEDSAFGGGSMPNKAGVGGPVDPTKNLGMMQNGSVDPQAVGNKSLDANDPNNYNSVEEWKKANSIEGQRKTQTAEIQAKKEADRIADRKATKAKEVSDKIEADLKYKAKSIFEGPLNKDAKFLKTTDGKLDKKGVQAILDNKDLGKEFLKYMGYKEPTTTGDNDWIPFNEKTTEGTYPDMSETAIYDFLQEQEKKKSEKGKVETAEKGSSEKVEVIGPNGEKGRVFKDKVDDFLKSKKGWKRG